MKLRTLLKLALRSIAIVVLFNCFVASTRLGTLLLLSAEARAMHLEEVYIELGRAIIGLIFGFVLFKFADRFTVVFGRDYDFEERLEAVNVRSFVAAVYSVFGIWLIVFSVPDLLEEIIKLQTSYYGAAVNDINTAIHKFSIVGDAARILIGIALVRLRNWLPPLATLGKEVP